MKRALPILFFLACATFAVALRFLHDEGVFTFDLARALPHAFFPLVFMVKAKALLLFLYALPAQLGLRAFLIAHVALAAGAIFLTMGAAQKMNLPSPLLAGLALAGSLGFFVAAASGFANSDGAFFLALFLYLHAAKHRAAGFVVGALPFIRYELAFVVLVFLLVDRRLLRMAMVFPVGYFLCGAIYHHDLSWLLHGFSNLTQPAGIRRYEAPQLLDLVKFVLSSLAVNFSLLGFLGLFGSRNLRPILLAAAGTYLLLVAFAWLNWFGIDRSLRYHVAPLPLVALLAASWRWRPALTAALQVAALTIALFTNYGRDRQLQSRELIAAVKQSALYHGQPIYTDLQIARWSGASAMLANDSIAYEFEHYLTEAQRRDLLAALEREHVLVEPRLDHDVLYLIDPERDHRWRELVANLRSQPLDRWRLYASP